MDARKTNRTQHQPARSSNKKVINQTRKSFPNGHWLLPFMGGVLLSLLVIVAAAIAYQQK